MNIKFDYVAGFLFSENFQNIALIQKQKPEWQKGKLNAIGGKIETGETPDNAMRREFLEETGVEIENWKKFCVLRGESDDVWRVHFYYAVGDVFQCEKIESEEPIVCPIGEDWEFCGYPVIPNLRWLIPMALNFAKDLENCSAFRVVEVSQAFENTPAVDTIPPRAEDDAVSL